jgi:hypothetical protein
VDEFLFTPVLAGFWTHRDIVEDVFSLDDLLDVHEIIAVKWENEHRAQEASEKDHW